jgi:LysR family transcriptional regulator, hydrogen peroxide-inducible genes activator
MQLRELQYIVAIAQEKSFVRAAGRCFVSQPALSIAVKNIEEELGVSLFERSKAQVTITPIGQKIVAQAQRVLNETQVLKDLAQGGRDPLNGVLRLGAIYTVAPYLLPQLIAGLHIRAPAMPIEIEENFTHNLEELLKGGQIDCALIALPFSLPGLVVDELYEEPFFVVVPASHPWAQRSSVEANELPNEHCILMSVGNCFRNHVLQSCPELNDPSTNLSRSNSLETVRNMVASGLGVSVMPAGALAGAYQTDLVCALPFEAPAPSRRIGLAYRPGFSRPQALDAVKAVVRALKLPHATFLDDSGGIEKTKKPVAKPV